ncbi:MAG: aminoacyl-histidine dipeptidase [Oscillospiraceae bacterium]
MVLENFLEMCKIPRGSGNMQQISEFFVEFAKKNNLQYIKDDTNNVIIKKDAKNNKAPVILQGHMDMVCEKTENSNHNFLTDSIKTITNGDFLSADNTTLGADNGIGCSLIMEILKCQDENLPPIEAVITTDEETGMFGANGLDLKNLSGNTLINLDSEEEGVFCVSCAGGIRTDLNFPIRRIKVKKDFYKISVSGLLGGHSGLNIKDNRGNAYKILARILSYVDCLIADIKGGMKDNAIPREAYAIVACDDVDIKELADTIVSEFAITEPNLSISCQKVEKQGIALDAFSTKKIIDAITVIPNGIQSVDALGNIETSLNLGMVELKKNSAHLTSLIRSSVESRKQFIARKIKHLSRLLDGDIDFYGDYPGWKYNENSKIRDLFCDAYKDLFGKDATVNSIHAGLECGILFKKNPNLDIISIGPEMYDVHTPQERVSLSSVERTYKLLLEVLKRS